MAANEMKNTNEPGFVKKVWITGSIFALIVVILLLVKATFNVFLLLLAGSLIAVYFRGLSSLIQRKTGWKPGISLAISIAGTFLLIITVFWLIGAKLQTQIAELSDTLPSTIENAKAQLMKSPFGQKIVEKASSPESMQKAQSLAGRVFQSTFGVFGDLYVILFLGIFFTASPKLYRDGIIQLVPKGGQKKAKDVWSKVGENLQKWLKGQLFAMFVVFVLTSIGLLILGVPMWLALAIIAGLLNFIPNFGPIIAMIPAVLVALMQGPGTAAIVAGIYILVQVIESNFITPMIQQKLVNIPPALIIIAQLLMAPLTGGWGLVLATPLMVILIVLVKELYVNNQQTESS